MRTLREYHEKSMNGVRKLLNKCRSYYVTNSCSRDLSSTDPGWSRDDEWSTPWTQWIEIKEENTLYLFLATEECLPMYVNQLSYHLPCLVNKLFTIIVPYINKHSKRTHVKNRVLVWRSRNPSCSVRVCTRTILSLHDKFLRVIYTWRSR